MLVALLLLALANPAEGEDRVRAVRIEAAHPERLEHLVDIVPGRPLEREAVRRTVELLYATGRYEDVRVELERGGREAGLTVVIRPVPAPPAPPTVPEPIREDPLQLQEWAATAAEVAIRSRG